MSGLFDTGDGFRVVAHSPFDNATTVEAFGSFAFRGESVRRDLILPVAVISGVVRHADGTPVAYPNVLVRWMSGPRAGNTSYAGGRFDGSYGLVVEQPGDFILTAQDGLSGQTQGVAGTVSDLTMAIPIDVTFGPTGSIAGTVVDGGGTGLVSRVRLNVAGLGFYQGVNTQAGGTFTFNNVPAVPFHLQACDSDAQGCGSAQGVVRPWNQFEVPDPTEVTMVRRAFTGVVNGVVRQANCTPLTTPAGITVYVPEYSGPFYYSGFRRSVTTTGAGAYSVDGVPPGTVIVAAFDSVTSATGVASAELTSQGPIVADVILGNATALPADFSDGAFRYAVGCQGSIIGSGHVGANDSLLYSAQQMFAYFGQTHVGTQFPCVDYGRSEPAVSRVGLSGGYQDSLGVSVSRDIFVSPAAGATHGFSRFLEVLTNSTTVDMTVTVSVEGNFYTNAQTTISSDSFGVFAAPGRTVVGVGIQDPTGTPPVGLAAMHFPSPADPYRYSYAWLVTVPAGQTRRLMHFLVQADTGADAGVTLDSLTRLTHPNALDGMTPEEKASVVNFVVPQ